MKKLALAILATTTLTTSALVQDVQADNRTGVYGGLNVGYATGDGRLKGDETAAGAAAGSKNIDQGTRGVIGGLHLGWNHMFNNNNLAAGIEVFGDLSSIKGQSSETEGTLSTKTEVRMKNSLGIALRLGGMIKEVLTYLKVGVVTSKWDFEHVVSSATTSNKANGDKRLTGFTFGPGFSHRIANRVALSGEAMYTIYDSQCLTNVLTPNPLDQVKAEHRPHTLDFRVRLSYLFGVPNEG